MKKWTNIDGFPMEVEIITGVTITCHLTGKIAQLVKVSDEKQIYIEEGFLFDSKYKLFENLCEGFVLLGQMTEEEKNGWLKSFE